MLATSDSTDTSMIHKVAMATTLKPAPFPDQMPRSKGGDELRRLDVVIAVTEPKLLNGAEALTVPGRSAMPVVFIMRN